MDARFTNPFGLVGVPVNGDGAGADVSAGGGKSMLPQAQPQQQPPNVTTAPNMANVFGGMMMNALAGSNWSAAGNGAGVGLAQQQQQQNPIQQQTTQQQQPPQQQQVLMGVGGAGFSVGGPGVVGLQQQQIGQQGGKSDSDAAAGGGRATMNAGGNASVSSQQTAALPQQLVLSAAGNMTPEPTATASTTTAAPFPFPPSGMVIDPQQQQQIMANLWLSQLAQQAHGGAMASGGAGNSGNVSINYPGTAVLGTVGGQQQQPQQQLVDAPGSSASTATNAVSSASPANEGTNSRGGEVAGDAASSVGGGGGVKPVLLADASASQQQQQQQLQPSMNAPFVNDGNGTKQGTAQAAASSPACWNPLMQQSQQQTLSGPQSGMAEKSSSDVSNSTAQQPIPLTMAMATMAPIPTSSTLAAMGASPLVMGWIQQQQQQSVEGSSNLTTSADVQQRTQVQPGQRKRQRQQQHESQTQTSSVPSIVVPAVPPMAITADMLQRQQAEGVEAGTNSSAAASGEQTGQPDGQQQQMRSDVVMPPGETSGGGALRPLTGPPTLLVTGDSSLSAAGAGVGGAGDGGGSGGRLGSPSEQGPQKPSSMPRSGNEGGSSHQSESATLPPLRTAESGGRYHHKTALDAAASSADRSADNKEDDSRRHQQSQREGRGKRVVKATNPDDERRQNRNLREQERSKKITNQIMELRSILSSSKIPYQPNKFSILQSVCGYVKQLQNHAALLDAERAKLVRTLAQTTEMMEAGGVGDGSIEAAGGGTTATALSSAGGGVSSMPARGPRTSSDADMLIVSDIDYRNVFHRCGMALAVATLDGRFIDCNKEFEMMCGYDREELLTLSVFHMFSNDDEMEEVFAKMGQMLKEEDDRGRELGTGSGDAVSGIGDGGVAERDGDGGNGGLLECQTYWSGNVETIPRPEGDGYMAEDPEEENKPRQHQHQFRMNITLARSGDGTPKFFNIALTTKRF